MIAPVWSVITTNWEPTTGTRDASVVKRTGTDAVPVPEGKVLSDPVAEGDRGEQGKDGEHQRGHDGTGLTDRVAERGAGLLEQGGREHPDVGGPEEYGCRALRRHHAVEAARRAAGRELSDPAATVGCRQPRVRHILVASVVDDTFRHVPFIPCVCGAR